MGKLVRKRPLGKPRNRWENNIKTVIQEVGCEGMDWMRRRLGTSGGGGAVVNVIMKIRFSLNARNFLAS